MTTSTVAFFSSPTQITFGPGALNRLPDLLQDSREQKALVISDPGIREAGILSRLTDLLDKAGFVYSVFDQVEPNPSSDTVVRGFEQYRQEEGNYLISLGGGSPMDTAKAIGILASNGGQIFDYEGAGKVTNKPPFHLCIPTTYGTGSEVTPYDVITDLKRKYKATIASSLIIPNAAILDAELAIALPLPIAGATGLDALTHAIEAYVGLGGNTITRSFAIQAIELISNNLRQAASSENNLEATQNMLIASNLAGMSFVMTRLGNVHAMSHPVSAHFNAPHGVANALLLPYVMAFNLIACPDRFARIAVAMGESVYGLSQVEAGRRAINAVRNLAADLAIPANLRKVGVTKEGIEPMAQDAMKSANISANPRKTTYRDIVSLYKTAL